MEKVARRMRRKGAFTLVELMIVVTIVAILALIAIPLYSANTVAGDHVRGRVGRRHDPHGSADLPRPERHLRRRHASERRRGGHPGDRR